MYNHQLDTFIQVADMGSFSKAAGQIHITPTAVIKQINSLEAKLGLQLFERTHRGLTLTKPGVSLYNDAKYLIQFCSNSIKLAKNAAEHSDNVIRVGVSLMTPGDFLLSLCTKIHELCPDIKFQLIPFDNTVYNAKEILGNFGRDIDVIASWFDDNYESVFGCAALKLKDDPICCAVGIHHNLASKSVLTVDDLRGETLMIINNWNPYVDHLRSFAIEQKINYEYFSYYDLSVFNQCENSNNILMAFDSWRNAHSLMKILPVEWDFTIPYGLLYSLEPSDVMKNFLEAVVKVSEI